MPSSNRRRLTPALLLSILTLCRLSMAYEAGVCDELHSGTFCTCEGNFRGGRRVVCFITVNVPRDADVWNALASVENLAHLKLTSMSQVLDYIPSDSLKGMYTLRTLSVDQARLGFLNTSTFENLPELRELKLDDNEIAGLGEEAMKDLPKLKELSLSGNLLQELLADWIKGADELEKLYLDRNNISRIETCAFCNLHSLRDLELSVNHITDLTDYMFRGLRYLNRLDLYKNKIRVLNDRVFHTMPRLADLDLSDNAIGHVAPRAFDGLHKLQTLKLNGNRIRLLPDMVFKSLPGLRIVDLIHNRLETLQGEVVDNMDNARDVRFAMSFKDNPIECDCRLQWVKTYLSRDISHLFMRELQDLQCSHNGEKETARLLQMVCTKNHKSKTIKDHRLKHLIIPVEEHESRTIDDYESRTMDGHGSRSMDGHESTTSMKQHVPAAIAVEKYSSLLPYGRKNKTKPTTMAEFDEDLETTEKEDVIESNIVGSLGSSSRGSPSGSATVLGGVKVVFLASLVSYFLVNKCKGALL